MAKQNLITHQINDVSVLQRESDGFFNATAMCKASGKLVSDYLRLSTTKSYFAELSADMGIPISGLNQVVKGGNVKTNQGTWVHPKVAIHLAQWLSPQFAVQVTNLVFDWMSGQAGNTLPVPLPRRKILEAKLVLIWSDQEVETTDLSDESLNFALSHVRPDAVVLSHKRVGDALDPARDGLAAGIHLWSEIGEMVQRRGVPA